jgi:D-sedoheptulose 7-phosphate isomerase
VKPIDLENHRRRNAGTPGRNGHIPPRAEIVHVLKTHFQEIKDTLDAIPALAIARVAEELLHAKSNGRTVFIIGNGGSAASACHAAVNWQKPNQRNANGGIRAISLADNVSVLTAWANDTGFENVFAAQIVSLARPGDVLIAMSGSGNSVNILRAVRAARETGMVTIGLSGFDGGALARLVDISVVTLWRYPGDDRGLAHGRRPRATVVLASRCGWMAWTKRDEGSRIIQERGGITGLFKDRQIVA